VLSFGHSYFPVVSKWGRFVDATYVANLTLSVAICHAGDKQRCPAGRYWLLETLGGLPFE
ncbi:hypothetical protein ACOJI9_005860, partial [Pseudomonas aeruginosa]